MTVALQAAANLELRRRERGDPSDLQPQPGRQAQFCDSRAQVTIYGGAAFGGKTYGLLIEPLRFVSERSFGMVIFRRTYAEIVKEGGLRDEAERLYPQAGGVYRASEYTWTFPGGGRVGFGHLQHAASRFEWKGAQLAAIGFDQLEEFEEEQFFYLLSRNRSARWQGAEPYIKATCNPLPDSWLAKLIAWWIGEDGYPIPERAGAVRYFARGADDRLVWADTAAEAKAAAASPEAEAHSVRFIPATAEDNPIGMEADSGYVARLAALPKAERERLRKGNWKVRDEGGRILPAVPVVSEHPGEHRNADGDRSDPIMQSVLGWDYAATKGGGDRTAAVRVDRLRSGRIVLWPKCERQVGPGQVKALIHAVTVQEQKTVTVTFPIDVGAAGKIVASDVASELSRSGFVVRTERVTGSKVMRATPLAAACTPPEGGSVGRVVIYDDGSGLADRLVIVMHNFTGEEGGVDDLVDAAADAFNEIEGIMGTDTPWEDIAANWGPVEELLK